MIRSGLIGRSILSSRSPWLHEQEARALGLNLAYALIDFTDRGLRNEDLPDTVARLRDEGFAGVNVTYPFKQAIIPLLDELADTARSVGAVNTVAMRDGRLIGHNTDMTGFRDSLSHGLPDARLGRVLQAGAGGAGAAVAYALLSSGVERLDLYDIDAGRAEPLAAQLRARYPGGEVVVRDTVEDDFAGIDGFVNATPIGMAATPGTPIPPERLSPHHWVADIVYFPLETALLRAARERGCATLDGRGMVVRQAAMAFEIMYGAKADISRMQRSFEALA